MLSSGPLHTDEQVLDNQEVLTYRSSVRTLDVAKKTCQRPWTIEMSGEGRVREIRARDDDDIYSVSQKWIHPSHFCRYLSEYPPKKLHP